MSDKDNENINISDVISKIKEKVALSSVDTDEPYIPDIIEFCYSKKYLNMKAIGKVGVKPISLFPMQQIILKSFYRGQAGNEHVKLTPEEIELLFTNKMQLVLDKYHSDALFRELVLVLGRRCVSEDTQLTLANGDKQTIGHLWDNNDHHIEVISLDERDYKLKHSNAEIIHNGEQNVYRVELQGGRSVEATDNHPLLTVKGWMNVSDLTVGECVAVPSCIRNSPDSEITKHEARLLGYMIGDGCCSTANLFFTCVNDEILDDFRSCLCKLSNNIEIKKDKWTSADSSDIQYKITKAEPESETFDDDGRKKTRPKKNALQKLLDDNELSGKTAHSKHVPTSVLRSSNECVAEFLRAVYSCDGSVYNKWSARDNCYKVSISYSSVSEQLTRDIAHLLLRFGINPRLRTRNVKSNYGTCTSYEIDIDSYNDVHLFLKSIGFIGKSADIPKQVEDKRIFWRVPKSTWDYIDSVKKERGITTDRELLGNESYSHERCRRGSCISRKQISKINKQLNDEHLDRIISSDVLWIPIKSIDFVGKKRTFDVSVSDEHRHNFVANDIILHNSGKDFMTSIIALYECMKLLECPSGSPFGYYGLAPGNPIYIITVATSADQARILYNEIKQRMQASEYFKNKIGKVEADRLWFLTPEDKKNNAEMVKQGMPSAQTPGSVCIMSGHSNSEGLLGKRIYCLLLDEVASFKTTGGATSGDRIYSALTPATADFKHPYKKYKDENGEEVPLLDSKIVSISSPRGEEGMLFHLYNTAPDNPNRIAFKLPTWKVNGMFSEASLRTEFKFMNPNEFMMEFGAEFSGTAGEKFIPDLYVDKAIEMGRNLGLMQRPTGTPGMIYYAHLDPAATSHNYALVVLHVEERIRVKENESGVPKKEKFKMFVVDHIKVWHPTPDKSVNVHEVDEYIIDLARRFRFGLVTYDSWNSLASIQKLRAKGVPTRMTPFRKQYKMQIYDHLEHLLVNHQIALPYKGSDAELLEMELKCLKRVYGPMGFKITPDDEALVTTDDCCVDVDTLVNTQSGTKRIKDVSTNDKVLTSKGRYMPVECASIHQNKHECCEIQPYYGMPVKMTNNHPVEVLRNGERLFVEAGDLRVSDRILRSWCNKQKNFEYDLLKYVPNVKSKHHNVEHIKEDEVRSPNPNAKWHKRKISSSDKNFGYICGLYLAEGFIGHHSVGFAGNINEYTIQQNLRDKSTATFGVEPTTPYQGEGNGCNIYLNSTLLRDLFLDLFAAKKATEKFVPECILRAPVEFQKEVVRGYFDGDGSYNEKHFTFTTTSKYLATDLQTMLLRMRIVSSISVSKRKGKTGTINNRTINYNADLYNVRISDSVSFNLLADILEIRLHKEQSKYHKPRYDFCGINTISVKIRSIKRIPTMREVCNLTVSTDSTFVAGGINTHNCDALAGACGMAMEQHYAGYAKGGVVNMPQSRSMALGQSWNIGRGNFAPQQWQFLNRKFGKLG